MTIFNFLGAKLPVTAGAQKSVTLTAFGSALDTVNSPRGILVDVSGKVTIQFTDGSSDTLTLTSGILHPFINFSQILSAGTALTISQIHIIY